MKNIIRSEFENLLNSIDSKSLDEISKEAVIFGHNKIYKFYQDLYDGTIPPKIGEEQIINPQRGKMIGGRDVFEVGQLIALEKKDLGKIVHIGGLIHNLDDSQQETLYSKLKFLNPTRATLASYDKF